MGPYMPSYYLELAQRAMCIHSSDVNSYFEKWFGLYLDVVLEGDIPSLYEPRGLICRKSTNPENDQSTFLI